MRLSSLAVAMAALALAACADRPTQVEPEPGVAPISPGVGPSFALAEGRYPTEEEYLAEGGSLTGGIWVDTPSGHFDGGLTSWSSKTKVTYHFVNEVSAKLDASIIGSTGSVINSGGDSHEWAAWLPTFVTVTKELSANVSTNGHHCGITGKARVTGRAALKLAKLDVVTVWAGNADESAPDRALDPCVATDECSSQIYYGDGDACNESGEPAEERGGGEGGDGGSKGGNYNCTLWRVDVYESYDGGETWYYIDSYYYWECW